MHLKVRLESISVPYAVQKHFDRTSVTQTLLFKVNLAQNEYKTLKKTTKRQKNLDL